MEPKLAQISPNEGTIGGTLITATVHGVVKGSKELSLVDAQGASICQSLNVVSYSKIECLTVAQAVADG